MKGVVFPGDRTTVLKDFPEPEPGPGEVVVRIRASGMCGSDLHFYRGSVSFAAGESIIQGHEPCGDVHAVGAGVADAVAKVGDRVMIHHYFGCGFCRSCRTGWPQMCETAPAKVMSITAHGGHAPYALVPAQTLLPLPDELSYKAGAAIGCGTGTAWGAIKRLGGVSDTTTVVFGQGPVGLSATMFAAAMGARVIAVDHHDARLDQARAFGADATVNSVDMDAVETVTELLHGRGADVVIDASGSAARDVFGVLGAWGRACFVGLPGDIELKFEECYKKQWTLMTSWTLSTVEQARCADFVVTHGLRVDDLYTRTWSLDQAAEAYEWFDKRSEGKGVFEF